MTVTSTHHGLSVYTGADDDMGADTADNRRLRRPVPETITVNNTFNDATSGEYYDFFSGHQGIDFPCGAGTAVEAMYGGIVVKVVNNWTVGTAESLGNFVTIRSCTDPATGAGFEHTYAHLQGGANIVVVKGMSVAKGDTIGTSGASGTYVKTPTPEDPNATTKPRAHLHAHVRAFGAKSTEMEGIVTEEYVPNKERKEREVEITKPYSRIDGCLNFACFLPPDTKAYAPAIGSGFFPSGSER